MDTRSNKTIKLFNLKYRFLDPEFRSFKFLIVISSLLIVGSWLTFGLIWWTIANTRNKLIENSQLSSYNKTSCIDEVPNIVEAFIFSVESQTTIGYGTRVLNPSCFDTIVILMFQLIVGCFIDTLTTGVFSQKLVSKFNNKKTLKFRNVVNITKSKEDELILEFKILRITNENLSKLKVKASVTHCEDNDIEDSDEELSEVISKLSDDSKHRINYKKYNLPLSYDQNCGKPDTKFVLFQWSVSLYHKINKQSSLWKIRNKLVECSDWIVLNLTIECFVGHSSFPHKSSKSYSGSDLKFNLNDASVVLTKKDKDTLFTIDGDF